MPKINKASKRKAPIFARSQLSKPYPFTEEGIAQAFLDEQAWQEKKVRQWEKQQQAHKEESSGN